jgi:glucokinase
MWNLIADIGGTNMRLAAVSLTGDLTAQWSAPSTGAGAIPVPDACAQFTTRQGQAPAAVVVAAAGVIQKGAVQLTNAENQRVSVSDLTRACGTADVTILNDFEAAAWSLDSIAADQVTTLRGPDLIPSGPRLIIGPGTGLGVGTMIQAHGRPHVIPGEGGHVSLAPHSAEELEYFTALVRTWPEVQIGEGCAIEAEAVLSGRWLPRFAAAIAQTRALPTPPEEAGAVFAAARDGSDPASVIAVDLFRRMLGTLAGDLGLMLNATGGVFISGGVAQANPWIFDARFLKAFISGGRHTQWRAGLPLYLCRDAEFGLTGARNYILNR